MIDNDNVYIQVLLKTLALMVLAFQDRQSVWRAALVVGVGLTEALIE